VSPYFQVLALFKSFQMKDASYSNHTRVKQLSVLSNTTLVTIKLNKLVKLSTWWLLQTNDAHIRESWWFESMYTMQGETRPTRHTHSMLSPRMTIDHTYLTWSMHSNLSWITDRFGQIPLLSRKRAPDTIHSTRADRSLGLYPVSIPSQQMKQ
jgi:hypothetical protein